MNQDRQKANFWKDSFLWFALAFITVFGTLAWLILPASEEHFTRLQALAAVTNLGVALALAYLTRRYVKATDHIASASEASSRAAQQALQANAQAAIEARQPLVKIAYPDPSQFMGFMTVAIRNVGVGPALNIQTWWTLNDNQSIVPRRKRRTFSALGVTDGAEMQWTSFSEVTPKASEPFEITSVYQDVFGNRFISTLHVPDAKSPHSFSFRAMKSDDIDPRLWGTEPSVPKSDSASS